MNSNEKIARIKKFTRIASKVIIALEVLFVFAVASILILVLMLGSGIIPAEISADALKELTLTLAVDGQNVNDLNLGGVMLPVVIGVVLFKCGLYLAVMETIRRMVRDISRSETPFEQIHVQRMKRIAIMIFVGSFINLFSIQANEWLVAAVVWLLAMIFDYGCVLQQESDETL